MSQFGAVCDEFYVSSRLYLKLEMSLERETVLHFFDRIRNEYPGLRKLPRQDDGCLLLEQEAPAPASRRRLLIDPPTPRRGPTLRPGSAPAVPRLRVGFPASASCR